MNVPDGFVLVGEMDLADLRARASVCQVLVSDFVNDGQGDVHGPHLAEPEVWARLNELEGSSVRLGAERSEGK